MKRIEDVLKNEKLMVDEIQVPDELEARLQQALNNRPAKNKRKNHWIKKAAVVCAVTILVGYNFDTLAFYSKRLVGYDQIMDGDLKELNELGKGQIIEKSYTFTNGLEVILDGIMLDKNQMLVFYRMKAPDGKLELLDTHINMEFKGLIGVYSSRGGQGELDEKNGEVKWVQSYEPPMFLEKTLRLVMRTSNGNMIEEGEITFKVDREKAMGFTLKKSLNKTIGAGDERITFESLIASPTQTTIKGSIQNIVELARDQIKGERMMPQNLTISLVVNGKKIAHQSAGMSTDFKGITFHQEFAPLPEEIESLEIHLESFSVNRDVNQKFSLNKKEKNQIIKVLGKEIQINQIQESEEDTLVTITTKDDVRLSRVSLLVNDEKIDIEETLEGDYVKTDGAILHTRTLGFPAKGADPVLFIERMTYTEDFGEVIRVPLD